MSQRQVNLKSRDFAADAVRNVQQVTQASLGAASEKAMLIGMNTAETLQLKYSEKIGSAPAETKSALNDYVRQEAMAIGELKAKASAPGATQVEINAYQEKLAQSISNLDAVAMYSVNASKSQSIYQGHLNAKKTGSTIGLLTDEALQNSELTEFDAALGSGMMKNFKVYTNKKTGHVEMSFDNLDGVNKSRDIWASNEAFKNTGQNLESFVINKEDNITTGAYPKALQQEISEFKDLVPVKSTKTVYNASTNTENKTVVSGVVDYEQNLLKNHKDFLLQKTTQPNFNKTWTQLQSLGYIEEEFKDMPWSTFTQGDRSVDGSVEQAIKNLKLTDDQTKLVDTDKSGGISKEEYIAYQDKFKESGASGIAKLANKMFGQPVETTLTEQEIVNKYKLDSSGRQTTNYTDAYKQSFAADYNKHYTPAENALDNAYKDGGAFAKVNNISKKNLMEFYRDNKELVEENYNITIGDGKNFMDQSTLIETFNKANIPIPEDLKKNVNGIFVINVDDTGTFEGGYNLIADENRIKFDKDGKITPEGKKNLFRTIGVEFDLYADANNNKLRKEASDYLPYNPMLQ